MTVQSESATFEGEKALTLSVVLPAHNELVLLGSTVMNIVSGLRRRNEQFELLIVENGSTDGTLRLARALAEKLPEVRVLALGRANYGSALREGFRGARGTTVVNFDVDYYDLAFLDKALAATRENEHAAEIVVASKRAEGARDERPIVRRGLTAAFCGLLRGALSLKVSDAHGMKVLKTSPLREIVEACQLRGNLFDVEMVLRAERNGLHIVELPAVVVERRPPRTSVARRSFESLAGLARLALVIRREDQKGWSLSSLPTRKMASREMDSSRS